MWIWIGRKEKAKPEILEAEILSTKESHPQHDFVDGPIKAFEEAQ